MGRRGPLTNDELRMIKAVKITDEEALKKFERDCYLRNLRPATINFYRNELAVLKNSLADINVKNEIVEMTETDIAEAFGNF